MKKPDNENMIHVEGNVYANEAGLRWLEQLRANADPKEHTRCFWGPAWQCPFMLKGQGMPCLHPKQHKQDVVGIGYIYWVEEYEPIGQMSLFAPRVTHRKVRRHYHSRRIVSDDAFPQLYQYSCRQMALAFIKWWEKNDILRPPAWRILPVGGKTNKAHQQWANEQIQKHGLKPCVFENDVL